MMRTQPRGFTIFFAVLVGSLALSIGLSIYELLVREIALSQVARESQFAIYAADAGAECALYWDNKCTGSGCVCISKDSSDNCILGTVFATSTDAADDNRTSGVTCTALSDGSSHDIAAAGWPSLTTNVDAPPSITTLPDSGSWVAWRELSQTVPVDDTNQATTTFLVLLGDRLSSPCAKVSVWKYRTTPTDPHRTLIVSRGYNTCSNSGLVRVERAFQVSY